MWNWYNRPGGISAIPTWKVALALAIAAIVCTIVLWLLYALLAPLLLRPVPRP
jgi:hypothetical protein